MYAYQEKDNLIFKLHPVTQLSFLGTVFLFSLIFSNPVYLLGFWLAMVMVIISAGIFDQWLVYCKCSLVMMLFIIIINVIFSGAGATVFYRVNGIAGLGELRFSMESLAFGFSMGLRLLVILSIFSLYTYVVNPDKVLGLLGKRGGKSILAVTISLRLFPLMMQDIKRISEIQRCRGVLRSQGNLWQRASMYKPIIGIMLISSLERSLQMAESMYARGYGSGPRTYYHQAQWRPRDYLVMFLTAAAAAAGIGAIVEGWAAFTFYPVLEEIQITEIYYCGLLVFGLLFPAILNWGWKKWPQLKSRI